jgi:hypothetical protein
MNVLRKAPVAGGLYPRELWGLNVLYSLRHISLSQRICIHVVSKVTPCAMRIARAKTPSDKKRVSIRVFESISFPLSLVRVARVNRFKRKSRLPEIVPQDFIHSRGSVPPVLCDFFLE